MSDQSSKLPEGDFTWSTGSNYGLDGFYHIDDYGKGTDNGPRTQGGDNDVIHPGTGGYAQLPNDVVQTKKSELHEVPSHVAREEDAFNLTAFLEEGSYEGNSLVDLHWLDPTQDQDPNRLPHDDGDSVTELQEYWERFKPSRTREAVAFVPGQRDREDAILERRANGYTPEANPAEKLIDQGKVKSAVLSSMRRSHYGEPLEVIQADVHMTMGRLASRVDRAFPLIASDHGLAGNVFIREAAFPNLQGGQWDDVIRGRTSRARYLIASKGSALHDKGVFLGKKVVASVPWDEAFAFYAPRLKSAGYTIPEKGSPRERLRQAFLGGPPQEVLHRVATDKPVHVPPSDRISMREAKEAFPHLPDDTPYLAPKDHARSRRRQALIRIAKWVKAELLSKEDARRIAASSALPVDMMRTAAHLVLAGQSKVGVYAGEGEGALPRASKVSREQAWENLRRAEREVLQAQGEVEAAMMRKLELSIDKWVDHGQITMEEAQKLHDLRQRKSASEVFRIATALIHSVDRGQPIPQAEPAKPYDGPVFKAHVPEERTVERSPFQKRIAAAAREANANAADVVKMLRWARLQMTEGAAGQELDQLIRMRFASALVNASSDLLEEVRNQHEGLSGHVYVDAGAYASKTGTTGCDKGALRHKANPLKFVLAMDRCNGCVFANGCGGCTKYGKTLVSEPPVEDAVSYQETAIRLANSNDAEVVAYMFANNYEDEYGLSESDNPLSNITPNAAPSTDKLSEVLWGEMVIE